MQSVLSRLLQSYRRDTSGAIAPLFAIVFVLLSGFAALAIDVSRATNIQNRLNDAADAANLTAVRRAIEMAKEDGQRSKEEIEAAAAKVAEQAFHGNLQSLSGAELEKQTFTVTQTNSAWKSTIDFSARMTTSLAAIIGISKLDIAGHSQSSMSGGFPVLDVAMCVDSTGSMQMSLDAVKSNALGFYNSINNELRSRGIGEFPLMRVRMLYFRDFGDAIKGNWDLEPLRTSQFFALPDENSDFDAFVTPQYAYGGSDTPESGLECLNDAMSSNWLRPGDEAPGKNQTVTASYPLIVIWTDAPTHPVAFANSLENPKYPPATVMPRTMQGLLDKWNSDTVIPQQYKQILFFGDPDVTSADQAGFASGWPEVKRWPHFTVGGTLTEVNTSMIQFLVDGIEDTARSLQLTQ